MSDQEARDRRRRYARNTARLARINPSMVAPLVRAQLGIAAGRRNNGPPLAAESDPADTPSSNPPLYSLANYSQTNLPSSSERPRLTESSTYLELQRTITELNRAMTVGDRAISDMTRHSQDSTRHNTAGTSERLTRPRSHNPYDHNTEREADRAFKRRRLDSDVVIVPEVKPVSYGYDGRVNATDLDMEIEYCDGGEYHATHGDYGANNVLKDGHDVYCTHLNKCNLILKHVGSRPFTIKEIIIKAPPHGFTAPVQEGMIFVSMDSGDLLSRTAKYEIKYAPTRPPGPRPVLSIRYNPEGHAITATRQVSEVVDPSAGRMSAQIPDEFTSSTGLGFNVSTTFLNDSDSDSDAVSVASWQNWLDRRQGRGRRGQPQLVRRGRPTRPSRPARNVAGRDGEEAGRFATAEDMESMPRLDATNGEARLLSTEARRRFRLRRAARLAERAANQSNQNQLDREAVSRDLARDLRVARNTWNNPTPDQVAAVREYARNSMTERRWDYLASRLAQDIEILSNDSAHPSDALAVLNQYEYLLGNIEGHEGVGSSDDSEATSADEPEEARGNDEAMPGDDTQEDDTDGGNAIAADATSVASRAATWLDVQAEATNRPTTSAGHQGGTRTMEPPGTNAHDDATKATADSQDRSPNEDAAGSATGKPTEKDGLMAPHAHFFIDPDFSSRCKIVFEPEVSARYVLLKMWNPSEDHTGNIDIERIIVRGCAGPRMFPKLVPR